MARHIVCLTFDFDAMSGFISRGMTSPSPISRGEFGPNVAAPRILALLKKYRIPSSWYIPGHTLETYPAQCQQVFDAGHEIGHHGWSLDDYPHFEFVRTRESILPGLMNANLVLENWINGFLYMKKNMRWGLITYTFHPFVIGRGGRMLILEKLIRKLKDKGAVFTTLETAAAEYDKRVVFKGYSRVASTAT